MDLGSDKAQKTHSELYEFVSKNPRDARLIWKDAPNSNIFSYNATLAHKAAFCAGDQNKFWQFVDEILKSKANLREAGLNNISSRLKLDSTKLWECVNSTAAEAKINFSKNLMRSLGIKSSPALFVNNRKINLEEKIDLKQMLNTFIEK